ncbi:TetR/AcrR family transcriptional regulator [Rhodococcus sp. NPDC003318]|uniref:TetR/AcrR family transcriptional regulator n=1 Tax=Rhodococcus sp. NPDC003318 TaxID=3364503 RepID=UPI0036AC3752
MTGTEGVDRRSLRYAGRREELLGAVTEYVIANGVTDLSMRPLAKQIGVSHASLLHHFGSKDNLLAEVVESMRGESMPDPGVFENLDNPAESIRAWWALRMAEGELSRFRVLLEVYVRALLHPAENARFLENFVGQWLAVLESGLRAAGCPEDEVPSQATLILAQVRGLSLDLLATGDRGRVDRAFELFVTGIEAKLAAWAG